MDCVCRYVAENCRSERESSILASLLNCKEDKIQQKENLQMILRQWLCSAEREEDYISGFLKKVDEFNLDDYIRIIHFDSLKVPKIPFQMPVSRHYHGLKEMREGELDFLKTAVLSRSMDPLYLCCDMPVEDMAEDQDFSKKYMFGLAMALKKGLHINIIHNVERPMKDMMLGLENWVPLYMTGQISPYYIKGVQNEIYGHLHYSAGTVAMTGECISGHHDMAHYYLTNNREEAEFYRKNAEFLLKKAKPLMEIYRDQQKLELEKFLEEDSRVPGSRRRILAAPPLFLLPEELLNRILDRCNVKAKREIKEYQEKEKQRMEKIFLHSRVTDEYPKKNMRNIRLRCLLPAAFWKRIFSLIMKNTGHVQRQQKNMQKSRKHMNLSVQGLEDFAISRSTATWGNGAWYQRTRHRPYIL